VERKLREITYAEGESYTVFFVAFEKALMDTADAIKSVLSHRQKSLLLFKRCPTVGQTSFRPRGVHAIHRDLQPFGLRDFMRSDSLYTSGYTWDA
jgi:hypothetical protein